MSATEPTEASAPQAAEPTQRVPSPRSASAEPSAGRQVRTDLTRSAEDTPDGAAIQLVGALIIDAQDRVFLRRRAASSPHSPGCWDVVGGPRAAEETDRQALGREIERGTGWALRRVLAEVGGGSWHTGGSAYTERNWVVEVDGDLTVPELSWQRHPEYGWFSPSSLGPLEHSVRISGRVFVRDAVMAAHTWLARNPASRRTDLGRTL